MASNTDRELPGGPASDRAETRLSGVALWLGVLVILVWIGLILYLVWHRDDEEPAWSRLVFLFGSIEAVACAAAGAMFGTHIQRQRVVDARQRADKAEVEAEANRDVAAKGRALARVVKEKAKAGDLAGSGKGVHRLGGGATEGATESAEIDILEALADDVLAS